MNSVRITNEGTAGATSTGLINHRPIKAFTSSEESWFNIKGQFPAGVWIRFQRTYRLAKIGFRAWSPGYSGGNWPTVTEIVGSNDCSQWKTLLYIDNGGGFTRNSGVGPQEQFRTFTIPTENRLPFTCLGLRWPSGQGCNGIVRVGDIQMWEQLYSL